MASALVLAVLLSQLGGKTLALDVPKSTVEFRVNHKLHKVEGRANAVEAKAAVGEDGKILAMVRVPAASLDSGDANRDANMRDVLEVGKYPFVVYKAVAQLPSPLPRGAALDVTMKGELELHGVKRPLEIPAKVEIGDDGTVRVRGTTHVSLDAYHIERPSLLLVKLDDDCRIDVNLVMHDAKVLSSR
ncbi:MAG TPA: YceI family protein [Anaeromyxobacteraceae bacterium]|nr:YceI family protein [Anaeromyxobacteraceae bacterium]